MIPLESPPAVSGNLVDVLGGRIFPAQVDVAAGRIVKITELNEPQANFLLPGFVDSHVHIESSMLVPTEFARAAVIHGTVATVSDPHEIANVLGCQGVEYMLDNAAQTPLKFYFGAPSCVPATDFEHAGDRITADQVATLLDDSRIRYLSEMMNFPGVLAGDPQVMSKLQAARERGKPVDGHAPGLRGDEARRYIAAGITTDHECVSYEEAAEKIGHGANILIREGSAARNFDALIPLVDEHPDRCMFCSDDKHPDELLTGHIDVLVRRAVEQGTDLFHALRAACVNPVKHYGLKVGLLRPGDAADFLVVDNLERLQVLRTMIDGQVVAEHGETRLAPVEVPIVNRFAAAPRTADEFVVPIQPGRLNTIRAIDGQLITQREQIEPREIAGRAMADPARDLLKITVVNRYDSAPPAVGFIRGFGLSTGAIASSVAHDSHNIVAVGASDAELAAAVNLVVAAGGGLAVVADNLRKVLPLPIAGLMSAKPCAQVGRDYEQLDAQVKQLGTSLRAPFMTLSFMALLVIPELKLSDQGLFDGLAFRPVPLFDPEA